jgi:hypothetical protein
VVESNLVGDQACGGGLAGCSWAIDGHDDVIAASPGNRPGQRCFMRAGSLGALHARNVARDPTRVNRPSAYGQVRAAEPSSTTAATDQNEQHVVEGLTLQVGIRVPLQLADFKAPIPSAYHRQVGTGRRISPPSPLARTPRGG